MFLIRYLFGDGINWTELETDKYDDCKSSRHFKFTDTTYTALPFDRTAHDPNAEYGDKRAKQDIC